MIISHLNAKGSPSSFHEETGHEETGHEETGHEETGHEETGMMTLPTGKQVAANTLALSS